jgi:hypothetical protein
MISFILLAGQTYSTIKYRSQSEDDQQTTTLVQRIYFPQDQNYNRILAKNIIILHFTAKYNNLGTVAFYFNNYQKINSDWVWFRIKEINSSKWYYENKYNTDQFNPEYYFTFGFPVIYDSKNIEYQIEIESISGTPKNSISIHSKSNSFLAKYSYPKSYLSKNPNQIAPFVINKIKTYLGYLPKTDIINIAFKSSLPILIYLLILVNPLRILKQFKHLKKLENNPSLNRFFDIFNPIFIFTITFIIAGYFSTIGADPIHDGILLKPALDLNSGQVLFKDTFTQYGALTTFIQAFTLKIFGPFLIIIRLQTAFIYSLISFLLYLIYKRLLPKTILIVSLLIWIFMAPYYSMTFQPWSSVYALLFQTLTAYLLIIFTERKSLKYLIFAAISTNLTFWCRQPVGVLIFFAICSYFVYLLISNQIKYKLFDKYISHYIFVNLVVFLIFIIYFVFSNSLIDWFKQSILFAFAWGENNSEGFSFIKIINSLFPNSISPVSIWVLIPFSSILIFFANHKNKIISLLTFIGLASWFQYYPVVCIRHQYWGATPIIPLYCLFIYQLCEKYIFIKDKIPKNYIKYLAIIIALISFYPDISYRLKAGLFKFNTNYQYINEPTILKNMKLTVDEAIFYNYISLKISDYFEKNPGGNVVTNGVSPIYLTFDSRIKNIQPVYINWFHIIKSVYPNYMDILNKYIEKNKPLLITFWDQVPPGYCRIDNISNIDTASLSQPCQ